MKQYDVVVIGAGNGGLVSALTLQKAGKKVLLLEKGKMVGGFASSFKRGRFEFDTSLHELCDYGSSEHPGNVYQLFQRLDIHLPMQTLAECFQVISLTSDEVYSMPTGIENFIDAMEGYVPGSKESMIRFFDLCKDIKEALAYLNESKGQPDAEVLKSKYPNFMVVGSYSVDTVLKKLNMPLKAREILTTYWLYLGSPAGKLSFVHYATMVYSYVSLKPAIPFYRSHELSLLLSEEFKRQGGTLKLMTGAKQILIENEEVVGVKDENDVIYSTNHVIANISPNVVYGKMIDPKMVPRKAKSLTNSRTLGARGMCVYLGLNKSAEELGLNKYTYFIYNSLDSDKTYLQMKHVLNDNLVAVVMNNGIANASPEGTCIITLTSLVFGEEFDKMLKKDNYFALKEAIADHFIQVFENGTKKNIRDAIEEIEIATPLTFARYTGHPDGTIYGYMALKYDNLLPRLMNAEEEVYIKGLRFCGGFGSRLSGFSSSYLDGETTALKTLKEMK